MDAECYKQAYDFVCQVLQPACVVAGGEDEEEDAASPPCRGFCKEFWAGCGGRLSERLRAALDCGNFPEYADEGSCRPKPGEFCFFFLDGYIYNRGMAGMAGNLCCICSGRER